MEILFGAIVCGAICAAIASGRGRSGVGWFFIGFFFGCLPIIILLVLPDLTKEQAKYDRVKKENRRLKETVKKDRMIADSRQRATNLRLTAHDRALDLDTSPMNQIEGGQASGQPKQIVSQTEQPPPIPPSPSSGGASARWFYVHDDVQVGPMDLQGLQSAYEAGILQAETLIWRAGMDEWAPFADVPEVDIWNPEGDTDA